MKQVRIPVKGIKRNSPQGTDDGACDDVINMRFLNNAWRPLGSKVKLYDDNDYDRMVIHRQDDIYNWIGYISDTREIHNFNPETKAVIQTIVTLNTTEILRNIVFVKKFIIISTSETMYYFLYYNTEVLYKRVDLQSLANRFSATILNTNNTYETTEVGTDAESLLGKYYKRINENSDNSKFNGSFFYRFALKLFDGSYVLHSGPAYHNICDLSLDIALSNSSGNYAYNLHFSELSGFISYTELLAPNTLDQIKDIVTSVVIFASKIEPMFDVEEVTDANIASWVPNPGDSILLSTELDVASPFKEDINDSIAWYNIGEISLSDLVQDLVFTYSFKADIKYDLDGYYQNYATREVLTVDSFSHHYLAANASYIYNDRLNLGDTLQTLALPTYPGIASNLSLNPIIKGDAYTLDGSLDVKIQVILDTINGDKVVEINTSLNRYTKDLSPTTDFAFLPPGLLSYPDARAKEIIIFYNDGVKYSELYRANLIKSSFYNFAYVSNTDFNPSDTSATIDSGTNFTTLPILFTLSDLLVAGSPLTVNNQVIDNNRWQISEINNPLFFPAENSNQVGIGTILAFGTNTERIGTSQFGQFPIIVFMSTGRWIAEIGTGDVYITRIVPLDRDVIRDRDAKIDLAFGVVYITAEGLKVAQAKELTVISDPVEGYPDLNFIDNADFKYFANNANTVQMIDYLDKVDFLTYLQGAILGYNKNYETSELIVANPNYLYAYVYDLTSKTWYKLSEKISQFIPNYPELYAMSEKRSGLEAPYTLTKRIINVSEEEAGNTQCMVVTRALTMGLEDVFKKLHRTFARGYFTTKASAYAAAYVFASDDLKTWKFVTGNDMNTGEFKDIWITHSKGSSRFYIFVFAAELSVNHQSIVNRLAGFDTMYQDKRSQKLR